MGIERKNGVMPLELAIKREIACREKLQRLTMARDPLFHSQVPTPTFSQTPSSNPMSFPTRPPFPPGPASASDGDNHRKRKEPVVSDPWDYFCEICEVDCTCEFNLRMHIKGRRHKARLEELKSKRPTPVGGTDPKKLKRPHCELCGVFCGDHFSLWQHLLSRNHILKMITYDKRAKGGHGGSVLP